jgi:hypothetical protein
MSLILDGSNGLSDVDGSATTPAIRGTDANTGIFFPAADTIAFSEGGAEVARFNSSGNLQTIGTIGVGNATPSTSGAGITFPTTQSSSSDANTLDDYEEGTWTPTIVSGGGTISGTGRYTKVGRIVQFSIDAQLGGTRDGNTFIVGGLPFTNLDWTACSFYCQTFTPEGVQQASGLVQSTSTNLRVQTFGADAIGTDFGNGYANWSGCYAAA